MRITLSPSKALFTGPLTNADGSLLGLELYEEKKIPIESGALQAHAVAHMG